MDQSKSAAGPFIESLLDPHNKLRCRSVGQGQLRCADGRIAAEIRRRVGFGRISDNGDRRPWREHLPGQPRDNDGSRGSEFDIPVFRLAIFAFDVDPDVCVRIRPVQFGDDTAQLDCSRRIKVDRCCMVRKEAETGHQ